MQKAKRVRAALVKLDGVMDVYVNQDIGLQLSKSTPLTAEQVSSVLAAEGVEVSKLETSRRYLD